MLYQTEKLTQSAQVTGRMPSDMTIDEAVFPFVSVVIPHYGDGNNLRRCLDSLQGQTWPADRFEVIVADNNSAGGAEAVAKIAPGIRVVPAVEQGAGPARNAGAIFAKGSVLAFIDSDCTAAVGWITAGVTALQRYDYVGGQVITVTPDPTRITVAEAYEAVFAFNTKKYIEEDKFSVTANLFVPRAIFDEVGGFRKGVSEDMDWCRRANALGYRLGYADAAIVRHPARHDWGELVQKWNRIIPERFRLESERPGWRWRWLCHMALIAISPIPHSFRVFFNPSLPGLRPKALGLAGLFGIRFYRAWRMGKYAVGLEPHAARRV